MFFLNFEELLLTAIMIALLLLIFVYCNMIYFNLRFIIDQNLEVSENLLDSMNKIQACQVSSLETLNLLLRQQSELKDQNEMTNKSSFGEKNERKKINSAFAGQRVNHE